MKNKRVMALLERGALLFDGATGTYARTRPGFPEGPVELSCLSAPQEVAALHRAYLRAGSRAIKTNTFAAHVGLAVTDAQQQREVLLAAVEIARREAEAADALVFADIGPAPAGGDAQTAYAAMADVFLETGMDCFLLETLPGDEGVKETLERIRGRRPDAFIAVSFAADPDGFTRSGAPVSELITRVDALGTADAIGLNCVCGAYHMRRLLRGLPPVSAVKLAMPNAGYPHVEDGRLFYDSDPGYYAQQAAACVQEGAGILGGCCGTTPEHIRRVAQLLGRPQRIAIAKSALAAEPERIAIAQSAPAAEPERSAQERRCQSRIREKLASGGRVTLVELDPPGTAEIGRFLEGARMIAAAGADAVTIADCPIGRARMDASLLACKLHRELGLETLPHMTCRDRNVNATKALLLGLSMEGVHNVLTVTGDPVPTGDRGSVKGVFQFNSRVLARFVRSLAAGGETEPFFLCGALNVNAVCFERELERALEKEACGVEAFLTQPVLSEQAAKNLSAARRALSGWLIGGLFPVVSHRNALFLHSEVAGVTVDEAVMRAYEGLDREQGEAMAVRLCQTAAGRIRADTDGFYIMTPFQRTTLSARVVEAVRRDCP